MFRWGKIFIQNIIYHLFFHSEIFLPWQFYLEYKLLGVGIPCRYSEYLLVVKRIRPKRVGKNGSGIGIGIELELINLMWNWN